MDSKKQTIVKQAIGLVESLLGEMNHHKSNMDKAISNTEKILRELKDIDTPPSTPINQPIIDRMDRVDKLYTKVIYFGWPSHFGGADTKAWHLIDLLRSSEFELTFVPNNPDQLKQGVWVNYLEDSGFSAVKFDDLPTDLSDYVGISFSNQMFFKDKICEKAKARGCKIIWSSEMMWHHDGELDGIAKNQVDKVLYTSNIQKDRLNYPDSLPWAITGNYVNPVHYPFKEREFSPELVTIGRLSRDDPDKYTEDFPVFYENLNIPHVKYRVMAWSKALGDKYKWHNFDHRWNLLSPNQEQATKFLQSLDYFVYPLGHKFTESWGRSTVEAMLTGAIPLVHTEHHLEELIVHGKTGYICYDFVDFYKNIHNLISNPEDAKKMSRACNEHARNVLCNKDSHLQLWREAFTL